MVSDFLSYCPTLTKSEIHQISSRICVTNSEFTVPNFSESFFFRCKWNFLFYINHVFFFYPFYKTLIKRSTDARKVGNWWTNQFWLTNCIPMQVIFNKIDTIFFSSLYTHFCILRGFWWFGILHFGSFGQPGQQWKFLFC